MEFILNPDGTASQGPGEPAGEAAADLIKDSNTASFAADVLDASTQVPVIVDFWAPWGGPCTPLTPTIDNGVCQAGKEGAGRRDGHERRLEAGDGGGALSEHRAVRAGFEVGASGRCR